MKRFLQEKAKILYDNWWTFEWINIIYFYDSGNNSMDKFRYTQMCVYAYISNDYVIRSSAHRFANNWTMHANTIEMWRIYDKWWQSRLANHNRNIHWQQNNWLLFLFLHNIPFH